MKTNEVNIMDDKVICILKRAVCSDEEWQEYEEKVDSEMKLSKSFVVLGKVLEAEKERKTISLSLGSRKYLIYL